jgi:hypothetical protein
MKTQVVQRLPKRVENVKGRMPQKGANEIILHQFSEKG